MSKFFKTKMKVITLKSKNDLYALTVKQVKEADIVIASLDLYVASGAHWGVIGEVI